MTVDHLNFTLKDLGFMGDDQFPVLWNFSSILQTRYIQINKNIIHQVIHSFLYIKFNIN